MLRGVSSVAPLHLLLINTINKTEFAIFVSLMCSLLPEDLHSEFILIGAVGVLFIIYDRFTIDKYHFIKTMVLISSN